MGELGSIYEVVFYVGFKQNWVIIYDMGNFEIIMMCISQVGMLFVFYFVYVDMVNMEDLMVCFDYLVNNSDGSCLLMVNFMFMLVCLGVFNDFLCWNNGLVFKLILIGQSCNGIYINWGDLDVYDQYWDFI